MATTRPRSELLACPYLQIIQLQALRAQLERAGFEIVRLRDDILDYFAGSWSFCHRKNRVFRIASVRGYDRFLFPPVFWSEHTPLTPTHRPEPARNRPGQNPAQYKIKKPREIARL